MASTTDKLQDPNLSEQEQDAIIGAFVRRHENDRLRQRWEQKLSTEYGVRKQPSAKVRNATIRKISIAILAVAASLLLFFVVVPQLNQPGGEELLAAYIAEVTIDNSRGTAETEAETLRRQVADAFNKEDYPAAVTAAERLALMAEARPEDALNLGKSYLLNNDHDAAQRVLRSLIAEATVYTTEARYALSLSLLSQKKTAEALEVLKNIRSADGTRIYQKARSLLETFE